jgi:hypothetical protein
MSVRNDILKHAIDSYPERMALRLVKHVREFKRHSLDKFGRVTFHTPDGDMVFKGNPESRVEFEYALTSWESSPPRDLQKIRWWDFRGVYTEYIRSRTEQSGTSHKTPIRGRHTVTW